MRNFAWNDFKDGNFAVRCKTEKYAIDFFKEVRQTDINYHGIDFPTWGLYEEATCYFINSHDELDSCHIDYCSYNKIPFVEWVSETIEKESK